MSQGDAQARVVGFDLLRGLCALGVATYHMLKWQGLAELHTLGLYGVYIFFVLSGASMTVAYGERFAKGFAVGRYLAQRYLRLLPLFLLVTLYVFLVETRLHGWHWAMSLRFLLNVSFLFGFANPGANALATGAWSLGIEFIFYLVFPLLIALRSPRARLWVALGALALQGVLVNLTLSDGGLEKRWSEYTQFGSFMGYFAVGVVIGDLALRAPRRSGWAWLPFIGLSVALATMSGPDATQTLVSWRGAMLTLVSVALVALAAWVNVPRWLTPMATWLGDISYALYLVHPVVFGALASRHLLQTSQATEPWRFVFLSIAGSLFVATLSWHLFEKRMLARGKRWLASVGS